MAGAAAAGPKFDVPTKKKWCQAQCRLRMGWEYSYSAPIAAVDVNMAEQFRPTKVFSAIVQFEHRDYYYYTAGQRARRSHAFQFCER